MRSVFSLILLTVIGLGVALALSGIPFGSPSENVGEHYIDSGRFDTGATNIVTSVVVGYRAFDTLGEVTILFVAAIGLGAILFAGKRNEERKKEEIEPASLILYTGCRFLFPLILLFGAYVFIHGHLTPGGGFQGGAVIASAFLMVYLGCRKRKISKAVARNTESISGLVFVVTGLTGLAVGGHYFLSNFLPEGTPNTLFSAGIIPIVYIVIGLKVGSELTGVIDNMIEDSE